MKLNTENNDKNLELLLEKHFGGIMPQNINSFLNDFKEQICTDDKNIDSEYATINQKLNENKNELIKLQSDLLYAQKISRVGSFYIDFIKKESRFSEMAAELLGFKENKSLEFSPDLIVSLRKNIVREDLNHIDQVWEKALKEKKEFEIRFRVNSINNKIINVNWLLKNTFSESGKLIKVAGTLQDVTRQIEQDDQNKVATLILEKSKLVLIKWLHEPGFPVQYVSKNVEQFGYTVDDFLEKRVVYDDIIYHEDKAALREDVKKRQANNDLEYTQIYRIVKKDGQICWIQDQTFIHKTGKHIESQGLLMDITDRIHAEEQLKTSEEKFRTLIQNSSDMVTILDPQGDIAYESPSFYKIFGYRPEDILGRNCFEFVHPEDIEEVLFRFKNLVEDINENNPVTYRFKAADGSYIYIESVGSNLIEHNHVKGLVVNSRDISERIQTENQLKNYMFNLEKINKELDQFAYIVSHDLKAPLRAIFNLSEWIQEDLEDKLDENNKEQFELMRSRIKRLENLIKGILDYSRAGRMAAEVVAFNTADTIKEIVDSIGATDKTKIKIDENLPKLTTEKILLEQVFSNFISNAIKYNDKATVEIEIGYKQEDGIHCFFVKDNGPGIPEEYQEKVFGIFQTLQSRDVVESTGIGLAIVKKIIEEKGGKTWVTSEVGKGSCFYFTWLD